MMPRGLAIVLGVVLLAATPCGADDEGSVHVLADFDGGDTSGEYGVRDSEASRVPAGPDGGKALQWRQAPADDGGWVFVEGVPADVRPFRHLRFRARRVGAYHDEVVVRLRSGDGSLGTEVRGLEETWKTIDLLLPEMRKKDDFDPEKVEYLTFVCWETKGFTIEVDDIVLVEGGGGWVYSSDERTAMGIDTAGPVYRVGDFEDDRVLQKYEAEGSAIASAEAKPRREGRCLRWNVPKGQKTSWITIPNVPEDIRAYRILRVSLRAMRRLPDEVYVRIWGGDGYLSTKLPDLKKKVWNDVTLLLPKMSNEDDFDPEKAWGLRFVVWDASGFELDIDDLELVKGAGGWKMSRDEHLVWLFGEKRKKKVKEVETQHFRVFTDSSAARGKFPRSLEKSYEFIRDTLGVGGFKEDDRLDVFIFQNPELYFDFCERRGWERAEAEATAGHAWSDFFATYYQSPTAAVVTHELTHSVFHRTMGTGGGSWFQEGAAVCVEERWQKRDAATLFAPQLRAGTFMPLRDFFKTDQLIRSHDVRGGSQTSHSLYLQAGAFYEFLLRGPFAQVRPDALGELARLEWDEQSIEKDVERVYGTSVEELETAWLEWGAKPPKLR